MKTEIDSTRAGVASAAPCSLCDCAAGDHMAKLPYFREKPLPVQVDVWTTPSGKVERTVSLKRGAASQRYLTDEELRGAEFFPANTRGMADDEIALPSPDGSGSAGK